ncbi:hypothetical protein ACVWW3_006284 [Bradyrhizobium sp. LM2.9]
MQVMTIEEPARQVPLYGEYEVVVLGGGPAGIVAAASAARAGRKTLLIERYGFLGGMGTAAGVTNFCGLHGNVYGQAHRLVQGMASELLARIDHLNGLNAPHLILGKVFAQAYDTAAYKIAADQLLASNKVHILFHALGAGVVMGDNSRIDALMVETKAGRRAVRSEIFIDCSGDGDLAVWAGAPFEFGDEHGHPMYPSMMLRLNGIDPEKAGEAWRTIPQLMEKATAAGTHTFPRKSAIVRPQKSGIEWRVNFTQVAREDGHAINGIEPDDLTRAARSKAASRRSPPSNSCAPCRALKNPISSICRRSSASARPAASPAATSSAARTCSAAPRSRIPSASTAGRSRPMFPATSSSPSRQSRNRAAITSCLTGCWCPKVSTICWSPAAAPR